MNTAPAAPATTTTPAAPARPGHLTTVQRTLIGIVCALVLVIAAIGFAGSYTAVSHLAAAKGFGKFSRVFPLGVDSGIGAFLALDLLLTWLRIPFPLLRYGAWTLTVATVEFNAAAAWPDPLGVGMHAVIPVLFVIAVEAARHAIGRIADITADKHIELPPVKRWIVAPWPTFRLWRRQIMWEIRSYEQAIVGERQRKVFRARLKSKYGRRWRSLASAEDLLALHLATRGGMTIADALALPEQEAAALEEAERERQKARDDERAEREKRQRKEQEEREQAERDEREQAEADARARRLKEEEDERQRKLAEARTAAELAAIQREQQNADADAERRRAQEQIELTRQQAAAEKEANELAQTRLRAQTETRRQAELTAEAQERTRRETQLAAAVKEQARLAAQHAATVATSRPASTSTSAGKFAGTTSRPAATSPTSASRPTTSPATATTTNAPASRPANDQPADHTDVVAAYQQLHTELGKPPSDAVLGERLGVSRSRAQQLRTAAIDAGHTELAKALRIA